MKRRYFANEGSKLNNKTTNVRRAIRRRIIRRDPILSWNKVLLPLGNEFSIKVLYEKISEYIGVKFYPVLFKITENGASFFVENDDIARAIQSASRRISNTFVIYVKKCNPPFTPLDTKRVDLIKTALQMRYKRNEELIDLSSFVDDPLIKQHNFALYRNDVMMAVITSIGALWPNLKCIDLSHNRLRFLDFFSNLQFRCPFVQKLSVSNNLIYDISQLQKLSLWSLTNLNLNENPLCGTYTDTTTYINIVREYFPNIVILDCVIVDEDVRNLCQSFVASYFNCFDGDRRYLIEAYDKDARLTSKTITKIGRELIVLFFCQDYPKTNHESYNIDVSFVTRDMIRLTVKGFCTFEAERKRFTREFSLIPNGSSASIINENLSVE